METRVVFFKETMGSPKDPGTFSTPQCYGKRFLPLFKKTLGLRVNVSPSH